MQVSGNALFVKTCGFRGRYPETVGLIHSEAGGRDEKQQGGAAVVACTNLGPDCSCIEQGTME